MTFAYIFDTHKTHGSICLPRWLARMVLAFLPDHWEAGDYDQAHAAF